MFCIPTTPRPPHPVPLLLRVPTRILLSREAGGELLIRPRRSTRRHLSASLSLKGQSVKQPAPAVAQPARHAALQHPIHTVKKDSNL